MEEKKQTKIKFKTAVILIIIGVILLGVFSANVYASTNGYGNVFFLIKYLVTGEKAEVTEKDELLSDRDITISYEPIALTENLKIQIRNLQIKDNKAKLIVAVNENLKTDLTPLAYKVYNEENKLICEQKSSKNENLTEYVEELLLNEFKNNDKILNLEVYNSKDEKLNRIIINLETREVTVEGAKEAIEKISETELKKYLSYITKYEDCKNNNDLKLVLIQDILCNLKNDLGIETEEYGRLYEVSKINNMLESLGFEKLPDSLNNGDLFKKVNVRGKYYYSIEVPDGVNPYAIVNITDISYCAGLYTAEFIYMKANSDINFDTKYNNLDKIQATIYFKLNEDKTYSTFKVVKFEKENSNEKKENNTVDVLIENNELIGSWEPSFAKENNQEISLRNIYGSGISGTMNFDSNGKYTAFIGIYSSEVEDDLQGDYINGRSSITLIAKSGKKEILTIKVIDGIKYLKKQIGITNQYVYFKKSASNSSNEDNKENNIVKNVKPNIGTFSAKSIIDDESNEDIIKWIIILENNKFEIPRS